MRSRTATDLKRGRRLQQARQDLDDLAMLVVHVGNVVAPEALAAVHRAPLQLPAENLSQSGSGLATVCMCGGYCVNGPNSPCRYPRSENPRKYQQLNEKHTVHLGAVLLKGAHALEKVGERGHQELAVGLRFSGGAGRGRAGQGRAGQGGAGQGRARQGGAGPTSTSSSWNTFCFRKPSADCSAFCLRGVTCGAAASGPGGTRTCNWLVSIHRVNIRDHGGRKFPLALGILGLFQQILHCQVLTRNCSRT